MPTADKSLAGKLATLVRRASLRWTARALSGLYSVYKWHAWLWRVMATNYQPWMNVPARLHAWMTCQLAVLHVPAYQEFLAEHDWRFRFWHLDSYPVTSKDNYVRRFPDHRRCWDGRLDVEGTVVDESSGSSGRPFNWVRGKGELADVHRNLAGFVKMMLRGEKRLFVINAYSMGAWATGTNTGIAMSRVAMVKNTGPDLDKIVDTMRHFGPRYSYVVTCYPPFLKDLRDRLDAEGWQWESWRMHALVGGEGMTEALRDYCEQRFVTVRSGYGASDLTIGIGGETDLTVWLRRTLIDDPELREALLGAGESRTPMIFQYNPLESYLETTGGGEIVCTLTSTRVLSPKLRYNIGDEGILLDWRDLMDLLARKERWSRPAQAAFQRSRMKLPLLLLFGRADSTISFMGANIYPQDVENGLYADTELAPKLAAFTVALEPSADDALTEQPTIHLELRESVVLAEDQRRVLAASTAEGVVSYLAKASRDFAESLRESDRARDLRVIVHEHGAGPFADRNDKIKRVYLRTNP